MTRPLRPYQLEAVNAVEARLTAGRLRPLLAMATASGKTRISAAIIERRPGRALFIAPFDAIIGQTVRAFRQDIPQRTVGVVQGSLNQHRASVVVASLQTISRPNRLRHIPRDYDTIMIDEVHCNLDAYKRVVDELAHDQTLVVGLSASPYRLDGRGLNEVFDEEIAYEFSIVDGIEQGYLAEIEAYEFTLPNADFSKIHTRKGDLEIKELETVMQAANYAEHITAKWREYASDRHTVIFVPKVAMARHLADYMCAEGIRAELLDGTMSKPVRNAILQRYESGQTQTMVNAFALSTGWDSAQTDCLVLAYPTKSKARKVQMLGRALRIHPGKRNALILDMVSATRGDLFSVASLAGVDRLEKGERFTEAKRRSAEEAAERGRREAEEAARLERDLEVRRVDLLRRQQQDAKWEAQKAAKRVAIARMTEGQTLRWDSVAGGERMEIRIKDCSFIFRLRQLPDGLWQVGMIRKESYGVAPDNWPGAIKRTVADARAVAEAKAKELLDAAKPAWMNEPASEKQLQTLRKFRVTCELGLTKGEAGKRLDQCFERAKARKGMRV